MIPSESTVPTRIQIWQALLGWRVVDFSRPVILEEHTLRTTSLRIDLCEAAAIGYSIDDIAIRAGYYLPLDYCLPE